MRLSNLQSGGGLRKDPVIRIEAVGTATVVRLGGELDLYNADQVRSAHANVLAESPERVEAAGGTGVAVRAFRQLAACGY